MKAASAALVVVVTLVNGKPFDQFQTTGFSNFDPDTGTFSVGSSTNLHQERTSNNAEDFLLAFENLFPEGGLPGDNINIFANSDGVCDEFCQSVFALDAQSQAQFEQDFLSFQAQFGNSLGQNGDESSPVQPRPRPSTSRPPVVPSNTNSLQPQKPKTQTQVFSFSPNNNVNKPDENFKSNTNNLKNKNFLFFGNENQKSPAQPKPRPTPPKRRPTQPPSTRSPSTPFTVFTTTRPSRSKPTPTEEVKNSVVTARAPVTISEKTTTTARPAETTSKKSTKIKWTYNGKTIGTSTITSKPPIARSDEGGEDKLPISTYFNEVENEDSNRQERKMNVDSSKDNSNFPVFDAVPN